MDICGTVARCFGNFDAVAWVVVGIQGLQQAQHIGDCGDIGTVGTATGEIHGGNNASTRGLTKNNTADGKGDGLAGGKLKRPIGIGQSAMRVGGIGNARYLAVHKPPREAFHNVEVKGVGNTYIISICGGYLDVNGAQVSRSRCSCEGACCCIKL